MPVSEQTANARVSDNYAGLANFLIVNVDGTDFVDCHRGVQKAIEYAKSGEGAAMVHAQCVRIGAHSNSDNQSLYRSEEEVAEAETHDPLVRLRQQFGQGVHHIIERA